MAGQASDWVSAEELGHQLQVALGSPYASQLPLFLSVAVDAVQEWSGLPLLDEVVPLTRCSTSAGEMNPLDLGETAYLIDVSRVEYREEARGEYAMLERLDGGQVVPDVGALVIEPSSTRLRQAWLHPRPTGWPAATDLVVYGRFGVFPADHPRIINALILHCRMQMEGRPTASSEARWKAVLTPTTRNRLVASETGRS